MIPVEVVFCFLIGVFGLIGTGRKFPVELGATIGFTAMLLSLLLAGDRLSRLSTRAADAAGLGLEESLVRWLGISLFIGLWVGFMYVGQTLTFTGTWPPSRIVGTLLDAAVGLFNGWLVIGSWWHYSHALGYPLRHLGWFEPPVSATAESLVSLTPPAIVPEGHGVLLVTAFLVFLLALRVFR